MLPEDASHARECLAYLVKQAKIGVIHSRDGDVKDVDNNAAIVLNSIAIITGTLKGTIVEFDYVLIGFLTSPVELPGCPNGLPIGSIWQELRGDGWQYPWRILGYKGGTARGYPCGEPSRVL